MHAVRLLHRVVPAMLLALASAFCQAQEFPREWGARWQPKLPLRERHPSLFYEESDRTRMRDRTRKQPWAAWWSLLESEPTQTARALKWWLTGAESQAAKSREDLLQNPIWRQSPEGYLEPSSHRLADFVIAYDLLAAWKGLSPQDHAALRSKIAAEAEHYFAILSGGARGGANYGNQRTLAASALGMAALVLCEYRGSPNGPAAWLRRALYEIRREENYGFFRPGGLFVEGTGYTGYMNCQFVPFAIAYQRASGRSLLADPRLKQWLIFSAYQMMANGEIIPWGTCESQIGLSELSLLCNRRYGRDLEPLFRKAYQLAASAIVHSYHAHIALAVHEPGAKDAPVPASRAFPGSETVVLRENWGHDAVAVWFAGKDGSWPLAERYDTYSHADCSHFMLTAWDEVLAADSGYDHWQSHDYYDAHFHNVLLIDGQGPRQETPGTMSHIRTTGPVRHARVTTTYEGCTLRRTLALVRGRYVLVADVIASGREHDYTWQLRSACPPASDGNRPPGRAITWPGLSASRWRALEPGRTALTTVAPPFARWSLATGRWRPISDKPEFLNQVALARWHGASATALFALIPNLQEHPDVTWTPGQGQDLTVQGPGWEDRIHITARELHIQGSDGRTDARLAL